MSVTGCAVRSAAAAVLAISLAGCGGDSSSADPVDAGADNGVDTGLDGEVGGGGSATGTPDTTRTAPQTTAPQATGGATGTPGGEQGPIEIVETSFDLSLAGMPGDEDPLTVSVPSPGTYTFRAINDADIVHALTVQGHGLDVSTGDIRPGQTATLEVTFPEAGEYDLYCPVAGHKELGMDGSVTVQGS